jgi:hypothetical protein
VLAMSRRAERKLTPPTIASRHPPVLACQHSLSLGCRPAIARCQPGGLPVVHPSLAAMHPGLSTLMANVGRRC